jgi:hypothetical protein
MLLIMCIMLHKPVRSQARRPLAGHRETDIADIAQSGKLDPMYF